VSIAGIGLGNKGKRVERIQKSMFIETICVQHHHHLRKFKKLTVVNGPKMRAARKASYSDIPPPKNSCSR